MIERGWGWLAVAITLVAFIGVTNVDAQAQDTGSARFSEGVEAPQVGGESEGASTRVRESLTSLLLLRDLRRLAALRYALCLGHGSGQ
jgi:hypothetical protein